ncbi:IS30 family transposase [Gottfriedia sp. NPDC057948]|uniref:IS30 family transposase n=1 Tax=Gottfriedia sp. NPDC057948 TaxID=3346287 RepID=UPI0036DF6C88
MSYTHLTTFERGKLEALHQAGYSTRAIARELGRHHSTIARELKRNIHMEKHYDSQAAHTIYSQRRTACQPKGKWTQELCEKIQEKLHLTWSPEQIENRLLKDRISFKTIYNWLYKGLLSMSDVSVLRQKGKRQKPRETRGRFNIGTSIHKRPKEVKKRNTFGHWELDTVVSGRGKSKGCLATFIERKTRFYQAVKMPDRTSSSMEEAIKYVTSLYPKETFISATVDRGKEFACYEQVEKELPIHVYFADPYSSWQRGSNENANGLLREFFPKGTDLAIVTQEEVTQAVSLINYRPRKCLNWKTAHEAFHSELSHLA